MYGHGPLFNLSTVLIIQCGYLPGHGLTDLSGGIPGGPLLIMYMILTGIPIVLTTVFVTVTGLQEHIISINLAERLL